MHWLQIRALDQHRYRVSIFDTWQFYEGERDPGGNFPTGQVASGRVIGMTHTGDVVTVTMDNGMSIALDAATQDPLLCWARDDRTETWYEWLHRFFPGQVDA